MYALRSKTFLENNGPEPVGQAEKHFDPAHTGRSAINWRLISGRLPFTVPHHDSILKPPVIALRCGENNTFIPDIDKWENGITTSFRNKSAMLPTSTRRFIKQGGRDMAEIPHLFVRVHAAFQAPDGC
ncbi:MAG: hypothetical protein H6569_12075 [Lewinellaceae bacterium]|nr:hypothetical protein [Lewinellaceae bacterium]